MCDRIYVGMAGFQSDAQTVVEKLLFQKGLYELRENRKLSPQVATTMVSNLLYKHRFGGYIVSPIVAGLDPVTNKSYVAHTDGIGNICNPKDFVSTGCASEYVLNLCEGLLNWFKGGTYFWNLGFWRENMGPDELFEATAQAMLSAIDRDASSGYGVMIYTITKVILQTQNN